MATEALGQRRVQGSSAQPWIKRITGSAATAALTAPACVAGKVPDNAGIFEVSNFPAVRLIFGGSANNQTINYQVILWSKADASAATEGWIPFVIASGVATLGAKTYAVAGLGTTTNVIADTITNTIYTLGAECYSPADDTIAILSVPTRNATFIEVQTDLGTAAACDVFAQLGEGGGTSAEEDLSAVLGTATDAAIYGDNNGSINARLRALGVLLDFFVNDEENKMVNIYNGTGATINSGQLLHVSGYNAATSEFKVELADADGVSKPCQLVANMTVADSASGTASTTYDLGNIDTSAAGAVGDPVYLAASAGGWTLTAPTGADQLAQQVGVVTVDHATSGAIRFAPLVLGSAMTKGTASLQALSVTAAKVAADAVTDVKVAAGAAIAIAKLAAGTDGQIPVCAAVGGLPVYVTPSGAFTMTALGVATLTKWTHAAGLIANVTYTDDFVLGGPQLADDGNADHDTRLWWDKSKGAFRAGTAESTQWDDANVATWSTAVGHNITASGVSAFACGDTNIASGESSFAVGYGNTASGVQSAVPWGGSCVASGPVAAAYGQYALANKHGQVAHAAGRFSTTGDAQDIKLLSRNSSYDAEWTTLFLNGTSLLATIASGNSWNVIVKILGTSVLGAVKGAYTRLVRIANLAGTTALLGSVETIGTDFEDDANWNVQITADNVNDALKIEVKGAMLAAPVVTADGNGTLPSAGWLNVTGLTTAFTTTGMVYPSVVDDTGGFWHINIYKEVGRTTLIAHTATFNSDGAKALVADGGSGVGGTITIANVATAVADVDITVQVFQKVRWDAVVQGGSIGYATS